MEMLIFVTSAKN